MKRAIAASVIALACSAFSQDRTGEERVAALIERLKNERGRLLAEEQLLSIGKPAIPRMVQGLLAPVDPSHAEQILSVLSRMHEAADEVITELMGAYAEFDVAIYPALVRTAADLVLYSTLPHDALAEVLRPITARDSEVLLLDLTPELGAALLNQRQRLRNRMDFSVDYGKERLLSLLYSGRAYWQELSADLLGEMGEQAFSELPDLRIFLSQESPFEVEAWAPEGLKNVYFSSDGRLLTGPERSSVSYDFEVRTALANAMEKIAPENPTVITVVAAFRLRRHPDAFRRMSAATRLGQYGPEGEEIDHAVSALIEALQDAEARVVAEAVTALGMFGPQAKSAIPSLERLTGHDDPQIAERAKAALRQIRKSPPPLRSTSRGPTSASGR